MIAPLVTLDEAKIHLHIHEDDDSQDLDVNLRIDAASAIVMGYIKRKTTDEWELDTSPVQFRIPPDIKSATLLVIGELFLTREAGTSTVGSVIRGPLSQTVKDILHQYRDPTMA
jgi:hypothetical protein